MNQKHSSSPIQPTTLIPFSLCKFFIIKQGFFAKKTESVPKITMKDKKPISRRSTQFQISFPNQDDYFVAQILLHLPNLILSPESASALQWGCTKRRSRFNDSPINTSLTQNDVELEDTRPHSKAAEDSGGAAASPVTPLAFPPTQSDRKTTSHKRSREKYTAMIEELAHRRDLLKEEIGNVTNYYHKLIAHNSQLKAMKQEVLNSYQIKEEPKLELRQHHGINLGQPQPFVLDQMAEKIHHSFGPIPAHLGFNGLGPVGPFGIPDLNIQLRRVFYHLRETCSQINGPDLLKLGGEEWT